MHDELVGLIYESVIGPDGWSAFLHEFRVAMASTGALLMFGLPGMEGRRRDLREAEWPTHAIQELYYAKYQDANPIDYARMEVGLVYDLVEFVGREQYRNSDYYRDICAPTGAEHALVACIGDPHGARAWLNLSRDEAHGPYDETEFGLFRRLLPHLDRAMRIHAHLERSDAERGVYRHTADNLKLGVVLLDREGLVIEMNDVARDLLARGHALRLRDRRVCPTRAADQRRYETSLAGLLSAIGDGDSASFTAGSEAGAPCGMLMRRVRTPYTRRHTAAAVILYLREREEGVVLRADLVAGLFGLTPTEARLTVLLAAGLTLQESAARLGITEQTARTYSKRVFEKTATTRQVDLVRLVLGSVAALGAEP